eukprot:3861806-Amphidinium_carterae.1
MHPPLRTGKEEGNLSGNLLVSLWWSTLFSARTCAPGWAWASGTVCAQYSTAAAVRALAPKPFPRASQ